MTTLDEIADMARRVNEKYCQRHGITPDADWYVLKLQEETGEAAAAHLAALGRHRRSGDTDAVGQELADVICFALLIAGEHGVDIEAAIHKKWAVHDESPKPPGTPGTSL